MAPTLSMTMDQAQDLVNAWCAAIPDYEDTMARREAITEGFTPRQKRLIAVDELVTALALPFLPFEKVTEAEMSAVLQAAVADLTVSFWLFILEFHELED